MNESNPQMNEQITKTLSQYAAQLPDEEQQALIKKLKDDPVFFHQMGKAVAECALLLGAAAIQDDENYGLLKQKILFEVPHDTQEVINMRLYHIEQYNLFNISDILFSESEDEAKMQELNNRYEQRAKQFLEDYKLIISVRT